MSNAGGPRAFACLLYSQRIEPAFHETQPISQVRHMAKAPNSLLVPSASASLAALFHTVGFIFTFES